MKMKYEERSMQNNKGKEGFTLIEGCIVAGIAGIVLSIGLTIALYAGLGTVGWKSIRKHINYEDRYYQALNIADKNRDGNLDNKETEYFFTEVGVTRLPNQSMKDIRPSYSSLCDYIDKNK